MEPVKILDINGLLPAGYRVSGDGSVIIIERPDGSTGTMTLAEFECVLNEHFQRIGTAWWDAEIEKSIQGNRKPGDPEPKGLLGDPL